MLFEDNGDENFKENARLMISNRETSFEKAIRISSEEHNK
jgi:hypothetical protein